MHREEGRHVRRVQDTRHSLVCRWLFDRNWSEFLQMAGLTCLLLTISVWQLRGFGRISLAVFFCAVASLCASAVYDVRFRGDTSSILWGNTAFLMVIESLMLFFLGRNYAEIVAAMGGPRIHIILFGHALIIAFQIVQLIITARSISFRIKSLQIALILSALCVLFAFVLNLECFNTWQRWDSHNYFRGIKMISAHNLFLPGDRGLKVCGHVSSSYALYSLFFMALPGLSDLNALYLSNMVLVATDLILFFLIFRKLLPNASHYIHIFYAVVSTCIPSILGSVAYINTEHLLLTGTLLLVYALLCDNSSLIIFSAYTVCNARETGAAVAGSMIFVQLLYVFCNRKARTKKVYIYSWLFFLCLCVGCFWLFQYVSGNWTLSAQNSSASSIRMIDADAFNQFGFSLIHISDTLIGGLVVSFQWIFSLFIVLALFLVLIRRIKKQERSSSISGRGLCIIASGLVIFMIVTGAYLTFNLFRYYTVSSALLCIFGLCSAYYVLMTVLNGKIFHSVVVSAIFILLFAQSYVSIDPIMSAAYAGFDTGKMFLPALPQHTTEYIDPAFTDAVAINRQIMYLDKALDQAYTAIYDANSKGSVKVLHSSEYIYRPGRIGSAYAIWGYGYSNVEPPMWGHLNIQDGYRYLSYESDYSIEPSFVQADININEVMANYDHIYYVEMPWGDTVIEPLMERYPNISFDQTIEYRGWVLNLYKVK